MLNYLLAYMADYEIEYLKEQYTEEVIQILEEEKQKVIYIIEQMKEKDKEIDVYALLSENIEKFIN